MSGSSTGREQDSFDQIIERKNTDSLKYDFAIRRGMPQDVIPMWVADMDFKTAPAILDAIHKRTEHGIFGYTEVGDEYFESLATWMKTHHDWEVKRQWLVNTPGVVYALAMAVQAFSEPGGSVLIQPPVYYPFQEVIEDNHRKLVRNELVQGADGTYHMDLQDFENKIIREEVSLFLLCNPHNPVGRVWRREELLEIARICVRHHVVVVSDEIHQDFILEGHKHLVFADICEEIKKQTIVCTSPSKTFNLAGLQVSNIFIPDREIRHQFRRRIDASGYSQLNTLGLTACEAAYRNGGEWLAEVLEYIKANLDFLRQYLKENIPEISLVEPEGTYLVWLDLRGTGLTEKEQEELIVSRAGLWLDDGRIFGREGSGFWRMNIACPKAILEKAVKQLEKAVKTLK